MNIYDQIMPQVARRAARVLALSDFHSGHLVGLTHPDFNPHYDGDGAHAELSRHRAALWNWFAGEVDLLKPIDVLIVNGDCVDGKGEKSGSTELITADRNEQCDMAVAAIEHIGAKEIYMSFGTPYHAGKLEDWEKQISDKVHAVKIGSHDFVDVRGAIIDYRHFISASSIPHGQATPLLREKLWNVLWNEHKEYPHARIIIRSHVHYYVHIEKYEWDGIITPALQHYGSKFGGRRCSGVVDFGFTYIDIEDEDNIKCRARIRKMPTAQQMVLKSAA